MMTGSLVTEWLTVTTGLFSVFFLLSAFAWILSRDRKINDVEKQHENPEEEETHYIINSKNGNNTDNNSADGKICTKTDTTIMPSPMVRAMLPGATINNSSGIGIIENDDDSYLMIDDRTILNSPISHQEPSSSPFPSLPYFRQPSLPPTCILRPINHNQLTWWLHTKSHSTPDG